MTRGRRAANGDGSIYHRESDNRWVGSFIVNGKRRYVYGSVGGKKEEARQKLRKAQQEYEQGTLVDPSKVKVKDYLNYWIGIHGPTIRATTGAMYHSHLVNHLTPALGHIQLQRLSTDQIQKCYAVLSEEGLQASTIRFIHLILNAALSDAVEWGKLGRNPCSKVKLPRREKHEMKVLTQEQAQTLLQFIRGHKHECLITLALATGMRQGEMLALHWSDIDFERKVIQIRRTLTYTPKQGQLESEPKTAKSRRSITLAESALEALKQHRKAQLKARLPGASWEDKGLVFCNGRGNHIWSGHLHKEFKQLLRDAGLPAIRFHDLRHSAATAWLIMKVHPKIVQEILGHSSIAITMDIYSHVMPLLQQDAMVYMDSFLTGKVSAQEAI